MKAERGESYAPDRMATSEEVRQAIGASADGVAQLCWGHRHLRDFLAEGKHVGLKMSDLDLALLFENQENALLN